MLLELELENAKAILEDFAAKDDKVGPFTLLRVSCDMDAEVLAFFATDLKDRMFSLEDDLAGGALKVRDTGEVYPMARSEEMFGASLKVDYGIGAPMHFPDASIDNVRLTPWDGGGVTVYFDVKIRPDEVQFGKFYLLRKRPITITLEPAELAKMPEAA